MDKFIGTIVAVFAFFGGSMVMAEAGHYSDDPTLQTVYEGGYYAATGVECDYGAELRFAFATNVMAGKYNLDTLAALKTGKDKGENISAVVMGTDNYDVLYEFCMTEYSNYMDSSKRLTLGDAF